MAYIFIFINAGNFYDDIDSKKTKFNTNWYYNIMMPIFTLSGLLLGINRLVEPYVFITIRSYLKKNTEE